MRIIHFSDPHAGGKAEDFMAYLDKRWVGVFNYRFRRRFRHDLSCLSRAVEYILATRPDVAICTGDLTSTGQPGEFEQVKKILQPLRDSNIPLIYMPGNHDCYVKRPKCVKAMKDMVLYLNHGEYTFDELPRIKEIAGFDFILLNSSRPSNLLCSWGFISRKDSDYVVNIGESEKIRPRILVGHYPILEEHPILRMRHRLFGQKAIEKLLQQKKIDLSLCGHVHKPFTKIDASGRGECCAGSVTRNGTMSEIEYNPDQDIFSFKTIKLK